MGLLSPQDEATLKQHLSSITLPVQLVLFTQAFGGSDSGDVAKQILGELASLNDKITIVEKSFVLDTEDKAKFQIDKAPAIVILSDGTDTRMRMYGAPTYWNGNVYFGSAFGPLRQYGITSGKLEQVALGTYTYPASGQSGRGPIPIVSANGANNGIVWTAIRDLGGAGLLHAYDATNVNKLLYSTNYGNGSVFTAPTVINGKVYVTGGAVVYAYGLH